MVIPDREALCLAEFVTGASITALRAGLDVPEEDRDQVLSLTARRVSGEPLQYIIGICGFRHIDLRVGPGVFIPRPETELVAERALERLPSGGVLVDVGTGSGAIALAVAQERPDVVVYATEVSSAALEWARFNQERLGLDVELVSGDLLSGLPAELRGGIDVVVSNPPYVPKHHAAFLPVDVREHEPHRALFAGHGGLEVMQKLADEARAWLVPGGWLVLEIAADQRAAAEKELDRRGYDEISVRRDLAGRWRVAEGRRP